MGCISDVGCNKLQRSDRAHHKRVIMDNDAYVHRPVGVRPYCATQHHIAAEVRVTGRSPRLRPV